MISEAELERRLQQARQTRELEPDFFRCLLDAVVYAHAPISDDTRRLRLIQFNHPDGFLAIPFFTCEAKALVAAGNAAQLVKCSGRQLFAITSGATLMLNPNDGGCVLYPEEIAALLESGAIGRVDSFELSTDKPILVMDPADPPAWLVPMLFALYTALGYVEAAFLLEVASPEHPDQHSFLVALAVKPEYAERAARATIASIQPLCEKDRLGIDLTSFDPAAGKPEYLCNSGVERFFGPPLA